MRPEAVPLPDQEARTVTKAFVDTFVSCFCTPLQVHSDQGRNLEDKIYQEMCRFRRPERQASDLKPMVLSSASTGL